MKLSSHLVIGILIILLTIVFISNINASIIQIYPKNNSIITERQPTFVWIGKANKLIIDDNEEFVSPIVENIKGNSSPRGLWNDSDKIYQIKDALNFTTYYWKLTGSTNSSVLQFRIDSVVALELKNQTNLYNITNIGNTDLDVEVVEEKSSVWKITGNLILKLNETKQFNVKNKTIIVGKQR